MHLEGTNEVLARLFEKKRLLEAGDERHAAIRPLLLALAGGMRGVYGGGQVTALEHFGLTDTFDTVVGVSTGAPVAAYFISRQAEVGTNIYLEECVGGRFIDPQKFTMNANYLADVFRGVEGNKALDVTALRHARTQLFVGVTCAETGEGNLLCLNTAEDPILAIRASIAIPRLTGDPVRIGDRSYVDGGGAYPFPLAELIQRFDPTDVLILANAHQSEYEDANRALAANFAVRHFPKPVREVFAARSARFAEEHAGFRTQSRRAAMIWADANVAAFTQDDEVLRAGALAAKQHLIELLAQATGSSL